MNRLSFNIPVLLLLLFISCEKQETESAPAPQRELTIPEQVEQDLTDIISRDWTSLADTLDYFNTNFLSKGKFNGTGPDGIYYELSVEMTSLISLEAKFKVADSIWINTSGKLYPLQLNVRACNTDLTIAQTALDTTSIRIEQIEVHLPITFLFEEDIQAPLLYKDNEVGYLTRTEMENIDYTTGTYLVLHYTDDPRTFSFYDKSLTELLETLIDTDPLVYSSKQSVTEFVSDNERCKQSVTGFRETLAPEKGGDPRSGEDLPKPCHSSAAHTINI